MACPERTKQIKMYLEDMLDEHGYQDARAHLDECEDCRNFVSATGSVSYLIKELSNIRVPSDLAQTVLFEIKKIPSDVVQSAAQTAPIVESRQGSSWITWMVALVVLAAAIFGAWRFLPVRKMPSETTVPAMPEPHSRSLDEPEVIQVMSDVEEQVPPKPTPAPAPAPAPAAPQQPPQPQRPHGLVLVSEQPPPLVVNPEQWHLHVTGNKISRILGVVRQLSLPIRIGGPHFLFFELPREKAFEALRIFKSIGVISEFGTENFKNASSPTIQISVYLE